MKKENVSFDPNQECCSKRRGLTGDGVACPFMSSAQFESDRIFWRCNRFGEELKENSEHWLVRCDQCKSQL